MGVKITNNKINSKYFKRFKYRSRIARFQFLELDAFSKWGYPAVLLRSGEIACPANHNKRIFQVPLHTTAFMLIAHVKFILKKLQLWSLRT